MGQQTWKKNKKEKKMKEIWIKCEACGFTKKLTQYTEHLVDADCPVCGEYAWVEKTEEFYEDD